jgi:hypothetical protein
VPGPVHLVLSIPPEGVAEDEYSSWYDTHVAEILETPGFVAARRYWLAAAVPGRPPVEYRHLVVYVMDRPSEEPLADLGRRGRAGEMTMPDWFGEIRFASFDGRPLEDEELELPDHAYLVFSHAPRRFTTEEYYGWYYAHARENLTSDGFDEVWRYALTLDIADRESPSTAIHAAFYKVEGVLSELREALKRSFEAGRVDIPDWMPEGGFHSYDCVAAAALSRSVAGASSGH